jgi:hypothetical protein
MEEVLVNGIQPDFAATASRTATSQIAVLRNAEAQRRWLNIWSRFKYYRD